MTTTASTEIQSIILRRPEHSDLDGIFRCLQFYNLQVLSGDLQCADYGFDGDEILTVRNAIAHIDLTDKCWIADDGIDVLGFCCWDWRDPVKRSAKTVLISVLDAARTRGVGKLLQQRRQDEMRERNAVDVHTWSDDPRAVKWYQRTFGYQLLDYEPIRHSLHRFHFGGKSEVWAIHRGFVEQDKLAHLKLLL